MQLDPDKEIKKEMHTSWLARNKASRKKGNLYVLGKRGFGKCGRFFLIRTPYSMIQVGDFQKSKGTGGKKASLELFLFLVSFIMVKKNVWFYDNIFPIK